MTSVSFSSILSKYAQSIIIFFWLISTTVYLKIFGIVTSLEAEKYISEAQRFINNGTFSAPRYWFYCITIFIILIALKLKIGLIGAVIIQSLLNICAYLFFYNELKKIFKIPQTAFFIIIYLLIFLPYQSWVVFLYTESAFFSLILILFSILLRYKTYGIKNLFVIGIVLFFVIISRPLGILFAASIYVYFFYCADKKWKIILSFFSILLFTFSFFIINTIFSSISDWSITQAFEQQSIICDLPDTSSSFPKLNLAVIGSPVSKLFYYVTHNFTHFIHFAGVKLQYFFFMTRPYYSKSHNYFLLLNTIAIYFFIVAGFFITPVKFRKEIIAFLATSIICYTIAIVFQCDDYHNRFILSIYPFFVILAARTIEELLLVFFKNNKKTTGVCIEKTIV